MDAGLVKYLGVSNFSVLQACPKPFSLDLKLRYLRAVRLSLAGGLVLDPPPPLPPPSQVAQAHFEPPYIFAAQPWCASSKHTNRT